MGRRAMLKLRRTRGGKEYNPKRLECPMDEKHRIDGFKALLASEKANSFYLEVSDGSRKLWRELSAEDRLEVIARDAAYYAVPFEQFDEAVRESVKSAAIEEAALRLAMRNTRELHELETLFPDDGRTESSPPLVERVSDLLDAVSREHESQSLTKEQQAAFFNDMRADEAAVTREDVHRYGKEAYQKMIDGTAKAPAAAKAKDRGIDR